MQRMSIDQSVRVKVSGALGRVVEAAEDGSSGFVELPPPDDPTAPTVVRFGPPRPIRVFFTASELESA